MPRTRSGKEHDPVKAEEDRQRAKELKEMYKEIDLGLKEKKAKADKKKMLAHFKMAVTKKHTVGSIKLKKAKGGKTRRRNRRV